MLSALPALGLFTLLFAGRDGQFDQKVGLLSTFGSGCLMIRNASLPSGTPLTSIGGNKTAARFSIAAKLAHTCDPVHLASDEEGMSYYSVLTNGELADTETGEWLVYAGGTARKTGSGWLLDGVPATARDCASTESAIFTLWSGTPLKSTRLFQYQHYLGFDLVPNCKPKDFAER